MSREIKFKALTHEGNIIKDIGSIEFFKDGTIIVNENIPVKQLIQYIEPKDKNEKEICEGDILQHNKNKYIVKYSKNQFVLLLKEIGSDTNWRSLEWCNNVSKYIEIIGNVFDNPELLK